MVSSFDSKAVPLSAPVLVSATSLMSAEEVALGVASSSVSSLVDGAAVVVGEVALDVVLDDPLEGGVVGVFTAVVGSAVVLDVGLGVAAVGEIVVEGFALLVDALLVGAVLGRVSDVSPAAAGLPPSVHAEVTTSSVPHMSARDASGQRVDWRRSAGGGIQRG